ncbi:MAG: pseudaminic acid cytidylyltransferase [Lachnospiraceae bacterium]|nr:pseudaminic acid cytidylyltransferase [Lachnospiraceae bacterium]
MKKIAIITARGGSKRIPRKNIKPFLGKPIILYSIEAALESGIFDEVMVSTDDEEIAEIAKNAGASVPFMRSPETSNDYATTTDVLLEVLKTYETMGKTFDYMACLYPTNPFITPVKLKKAMELIEGSDYAEVLPVVQFSFPPQRAYVFGDNDSLIYKWEEFKNARSQDLEKMYHDAGQFYCYDVKKYIENKGVKGKIYPLICPEHEVQDIDTEEDWKMAELKVEYMRRSAKQ